MKKLKCLLLTLLIVIGLSVIVCSCTLFQDSSDTPILPESPSTSTPSGSTTNPPSTSTPTTPSITSKPKITSVADIKPIGTFINLSVEKTEHSLELFKLVNITTGAIWKIYDKSDNLIANKVVSLANGNNTFYIEVSLPDGSYSTMYTLNIFKSYDITIEYLWREKAGAGYNKHSLKKVTIEQGELFKADYVPKINGYDFLYWHEYGRGGDSEYIEERPTYDMKLEAILQPKSATLHFIIDDIEWKTIETQYGERIKLSIPEKEHYNFVKWDYTSTGGGFIDSWGEEFYCYNYGDLYFYGKFEPKSYKIIYEYGEIRYNYKDYKNVQYGNDFEVVDPNVRSITTNGIKYIFSGFVYNGKPFVSGKYLYDGDITVQAVWIPEKND